MKYSDVIALLSRGLRSRDAEDYVGGASVLCELTRRWKLQPLIRQKGITVYDRHEIDAALDKHRAYRDTVGDTATAS